MNEALPPVGQPQPVPHSVLKKVFFITCIVVFLCAIVFLIYQNGKSIYDNGI